MKDILVCMCTYLDKRELTTRKAINLRKLFIIQIKSVVLRVFEIIKGAASHPACFKYLCKIHSNVSTFHPTLIVCYSIRISNTLKIPKIIKVRDFEIQRTLWNIDTLPETVNVANQFHSSISCNSTVYSV